MTIILTSPAFDDGKIIPQKYTCDGEEVSPALVWERLPAATKSIAILCDDPDAPGGNWVHWVLYGIPPTARGLPENIPPDRILNDGSKQGINDFKSIGYRGPCPPDGTHNYIFRIFALDTKVLLPSGVSEKQLLKAIKTHVLDEGRLAGRYKR